MSKIFSLDAPPFHHRRNEKYILAHGCFDLIHPWHLRHLEEAKSYGDILIVTVTADEYINKGTNRPIYPASERAYMLAGFQCVDYVAISNYPTAVYAIHKLRPDFMAKGVDYIGEGIIREEKDALDTIGAKLVFTNTEKMSTTEIIERCKRA